MGYGGVTIPPLMNILVNGKKIKKQAGDVNIELDKHLEELGLINISSSELEEIFLSVFEPETE